MKAKQANLLKFLQVSRQFVIPIYQRTYSWKEEQCAQLFHDILRISADDDGAGHFVGSVVYFEEEQRTSTEVSEHLIIDGQQRITSVTLLLSALAELAQAHPGLLDATTPTKLQNYYLFNAEESGELRYKLVLTRGDRQDLMDVLDQRPTLPNGPGSRIRTNYHYFRSQLTPQNARAVYTGLQRLFIVDVALERGLDNPQLIFESMNSTGLELSQADLIRNFVLMSQPPKLQTHLYNQYWFPMEQLFGSDHYGWHFDRFVRHYLTLHTGTIPRLDSVYQAYKAYLGTAPADPAAIEDRLRHLHHFAACYVAIALPERAQLTPTLRRAYYDLLELRADTTTPFLLQVHADALEGRLSASDHEAIVRLVEAYVFRRFVCDIPTNSHNKTFARLDRSIRPSHYLESVQAAIQLLDSYRRFPADEEFVHGLTVKPVYNTRLCNYLLEKLENQGRKEPVPVHEYTVEHILPQNETLSAEWRRDLGPDFKRIQRDYLHTLGNLTLTAYNSKLSDRSFEFKKTVEGGFAESPLRLNKTVAAEAIWNEDAIQRRAATLTAKARTIWGAPGLPAAVLAAYQTQPEEAGSNGTTYSLDQFTHLTGPLRSLFNEFHQRVLALDEAVKLEPKKLYIAFKVDTNFVDVEPQKSRLRLSLNLPFAHIQDPLGICRDITDVGRWGNGNVEVGLVTPSDLDHIMPLVQQAYHYQTGAGD